MQVTCYTVFDITRTRVVGHYNQASVPFRDHANQLVVDRDSWLRSRNQQRNWETLTQVLSLRTQLLNITDPVITTHAQWSEQTVWSFVFDIEFDTVLATDNNPLGLLLQDVDHVPMLLNLTETVSTSPWLSANDPLPNLMFIV